jgi:formate-dependent nitrite reductase membrane component NrfD
MSSLRPQDPARPPRVAKHLMTPGQPRVVRESMSVATVQKWVLSTLAATTILHLSGGLVFAAAFLEGTGKQVAMLVIASAFGMIAMAAALLIHQRSLVSPWLLVGLLPATVGVYFMYLR